MRYLIHPKDSEPFLTMWFYEDKHELGMIVYNLWNQTYTTNGTDWKPIAVNHL